MQKKSRVKDQFYDDKIVLKPWGYEYTLFRIQNEFRVILVNIKYKKNTSLHCHPSKKTGFIILDGNAKVQLGIYAFNKKIYKPLTTLVLRQGLYHSLKSVSKSGLYALEFEFPGNKDDLLRFKDSYGREKMNYEGKKSTKLNNFFRFEKLNSEDQSFTFKDKKIEIIQIRKKNDIKKISNLSSICILRGTITNKKKLVAVNAGEIMLGKTLLIFLKKFGLQNSKTLLIMSVKNI